VFATLGGSLPIPPRAPDDGSEGADGIDGLIRVAVAEQEAAGLEPITDGGLRHPDPVAAVAGGLEGLEIRVGAPPLVRWSPEWRAPVFVDGWRFVAACTDRAVKQAIIGPFTLGRAVASGRLGRERVTLALSEALNAEVRALAAAGCPLIEVVEDGAVAIGEDPTERRLFREAQSRLTAGIEGVHLSLAIRGGSAYPAGVETIFAAPYASYLFDLCAGPDNWRLVVAAPVDRGIVVGAEDASVARADGPELHAFAIGYAASTGGRGHDRIGLATSGDMGRLTWAAAQAKMTTIGRTAALYDGPPGALAAAMDPRAVDIRSAAHGRLAPDPRDRARRP
jgi:methionine synthase II (cobalamin-independent)